MEEAKKALDWALKALGRRDHSEAELARKLCGKGVSPEVVAETIGRLKALHYLDDRRFAERWAESAVRNGRGYGPRLRLELSRKGVPAEVIAEVLAGVAAEFDETETLTAIMAAKFAGFDPRVAPDREKRRVLDYLLRRGFSSAAVFEVFHRANGEG